MIGGTYDEPFVDFDSLVGGGSHRILVDVLEGADREVLLECGWNDIGCEALHKTNFVCFFLVLSENTERTDEDGLEYFFPSRTARG